MFSLEHERHPMIEIDLHRRQGAFDLSVTFSSAAGITALFGRSGSGKTSVVAMTAGLARADHGRVVVAGQTLLDTAKGIELPPEKRRIGYIFQDSRLFPHLSVRANLSYGENVTPRDQRYAEFDKVVALLGLASLLSRRPAKLSGGEKQRVAIGRALLTSPRLLLMDEPLAALDGARKAEVLPFIARLSREFGVPILYVSHSIDEILELADSLVVLESGRVMAAGGLEEVLGAHDLSAITGRQDAGSILLATVREHVPEWNISRLSVGGNILSVPMVDAVIGHQLRVRIGAQDVALALEPPVRTSIQNILKGTVLSVRPDGQGQCDIHVDLGGGVLWTKITRLSAENLGLSVGDEVFALVKSVSISRNSMAEWGISHMHK